jgi:hypothetical protein
MEGILLSSCCCTSYVLQLQKSLTNFKNFINITKSLTNLDSILFEIVLLALSSIYTYVTNLHLAALEVTPTTRKQNQEHPDEC